MGAKTPFSRPESDVFFVKLSFLADQMRGKPRPSQLAAQQLGGEAA